MGHHYAVILLLSCLVPCGSQASQVVLSEFMASNSRTVADETGNFADWIEIHNISTSPVNLLNWSLTDTPANLTKWRFPQTNLSAGAYLYLFASGADRRIPGAPLHTNFKLSAGGEYLALVEPDGSTIATQFSPAYPPQAPDVSYGFGLLTTNTALVSASAAGRFLVPAIANGGNPSSYQWTGANEPFDDSAWRNLVTGAGFSAGPSLVASTSLVVRFNFEAAPVANIIVDSKPSGTAHNGVNVGATWVATSTDSAPTPVSRSGVMRFNPSSSSQVTLAAHPDFNAKRGTIAFWMRSAGTTGAGNFGAMLVDRRTSSGDVIVLEDNGKIFVQASGGNQFDTFTSVADDRWHHVAYVYDQNAGGGTSLYLDGAFNRSNATAAAWLWPATQQLEIGRSHDPYWRLYNGLLDDFRIYNRQLSPTEIAQIATGDSSVSPADIGTNLQGEMLGIASSAFLRVPFVVDQPGNFSLLTLRMKYDDGFVAWINGIEVARANAPAPLDWDSSATSAHNATAAESILLGDPSALLHSGTNLLAIQGLNVASNDPSFLILPELIGASIPIENTNAIYFTTPTPGTPNLGGVKIPGPIIAQATHSPNVPLDMEDLLVTARVLPSFLAVSNVTLHYRIMHGPEMAAPMLDDGAHRDGAAGDGIFGASIPASASTNGQMIRYYIVASDAQTNSSRWPLFPDPAGSAQYLGTIVNPTNLTSKLPIFHLFIDPVNQGSADNAGSRCSLFYDSEFYDNVGIHVRGNTTSQASYLKRSHHLSFNNEHKFRYADSSARLSETSLLAEFIDPAYLRQFLSFWLMDQSGLNAPFHYPVRVQNNGSFYQLAFHSDVLGKDQLARFGLDPNGALYKACGVVDPSGESTGGFRKETRLSEDNSDYVAFANAIANARPLGQRRTNLFDMVDIPDVINYMAATRITSEEDDIWANMSLYRDSDGTKEWRIIPFDLNLSWGQIYGSPVIQATNDAFKNNPMYGNSQCIQAGGPFGAFNNFYDAIIAIPETRQMLLRRLRTIMDAFLQPPGTPPAEAVLEQKIAAMTNSFWAEAFLDRQLWQWPPNGAPYNWGPGLWLTNGVTDLINQYINPRRAHLYLKHSIANTALPIGLGNANNAGIPLTQPANALVAVAGVEFNPASGNQAEEYLCVTNPAPFALDLSGWRIDGAVQFTFKSGTVMPSNSALYVSPDVAAFRARATGPRGGQGLFVVGPYKGQLSARGETLRVTDDFGRLVSTNSYPGNPSAAQQFLRITELMYHPSPSPGNTNGPEEFEYVELKNIGTNVTLDLAGVRFTNGIVFTFTGSVLTSLGPGQTALIVRNLGAFITRYGSLPNIAGQYGGALNNGGERIQLVDAMGEEILDFTYNNKWYPITDGLGFSLVTVDEQADPDAWNSKTNWRPSGQTGGSPGANESVQPPIAPIRINEALTRSDLPPPAQSIELFNPTGIAVDLSGWFLTDDFLNPKKFRLVTGVRIAAGDYLLFDETQFDPFPGLFPSFSLNPEGGAVYLFSADASTNLTGYYHGFNFGAAENGVSFGRYATSLGEEHFVSQTAPTPGAANTGPKIGPLIISELMYHPPDIGSTDDTMDEFIEVFNLTTNNVRLFDPVAITNTWKLTGGVDFTFPTNQMLGPGEYLLLVNFDPATNGPALAAFQKTYPVPGNVQLFGPYAGKLNNGSDNVELKKPVLQHSGKWSYVLVDKVAYSSAAPWPQAADGFGLALQRKTPFQYGNDPASWFAAPPTPNSSIAITGWGPSIDRQPTNFTAVVGTNAAFSVIASGTGPLRYQWRFNGTNLIGATNSLLEVPNVQPWRAGNYEVAVFNAVGFALSSTVRLGVLFPPLLTSQPQNKSVRLPSLSSILATNVTFSVSAYTANPPLNYQWFLNGTNIPGATESSYTLTSVSLANQGTYQVIVSDSVASLPSASANLSILVAPAVVLPLPSPPITLLQGSSLSYTVSIVGYPPPFNYSWRRGAFVLTNLSINSTSCTLSLPNLQPSNSGLYRVVITNLATLPATIPANSTNTLTVLADSDGDGIPDAWETQFGFNPNDPGDANGDADGDGMSNLKEYLTGTNPTNSLSVFKIDQLDGGSGPTSIQFTALSNRTYSLQFKESLSSGRWTKLADVISRPSNRVETVSDPYPSTSSRLYRLATPQLPDQRASGPVMLASPQPVRAAVGDDVSFSVFAVGAGPISYQWFFKGGLLDGETAPNLLRSSVQLSDAGDYSVLLSDELGSRASDGAILALKPVIKVQPQNQDAVAGTEVMFSVTANGTGPLAYRWRHNRIILLEQTNGVLTLPAVEGKDAGSYSVIVKLQTPLGILATTSSNATLTILPSPSSP